jgi:hypothetical protein
MLPCPKILNGTLGFPSLTAFVLKTAAGSNPISVGSWIFDNSGTHQALASGGASVGYVVDAILEADGRTPYRPGHLTGTEAAAATFQLRLAPIGGLFFLIGEDGDGGLIDLVSNPTLLNFDVIVGTSVGIGDWLKTPDGYGRVEANILLDSSSGSASTSGLVFEVFSEAAQHNALTNVASLTNPAWGTGTTKAYVGRVIPAAAQYTQGAA